MTPRRRAIVSAVCALLVMPLVSDCSLGAAEAPAADPAAEGGRIHPSDLLYKGAFRLPDEPEEVGWGWSGQGLAFYPDGYT